MIILTGRFQIGLGPVKRRGILGVVILIFLNFVG